MTKNKLERKFFQSIVLDQSLVPNMLLRHYEDIGLNSDECIFLISMIGSMPRDKNYIVYNDIKKFWLGSEKDIQSFLAELSHKGYLTRNNSKRLEEGYTLDGLFEKLLECWVYLQACPKKEEQKHKKVMEHNSNSNFNDQNFAETVKQVYAIFEGEYARPLSPTEIEKINKWLIDDSWNGELIKEALKIAVFHGTNNLAYIDKILLSWQKQGVATLEQVHALNQDYKNAISEETNSKPTKSRKKQASNKVNIIDNETDYNKIYDV